MRACCHSRIMGMADKVSGEDIGGLAWWQRFGTTGIDTVVDEMQDGNRRDVGRRRWRNGLEERRRTEQIFSRNNYKPESVLLFQ